MTEKQLAERMLDVLSKFDEVVSAIRQILYDGARERGIGFVGSDEALALSETLTAMMGSTSPISNCLAIYLGDPHGRLHLGKALEERFASRAKENQTFEDWINIQQLQVYDGKGKKQ